LKELVRGTEQFRLAEAEGKLMRLPTGDGGIPRARTRTYTLGRYGFSAAEAHVDPRLISLFSTCIDAVIRVYDAACNVVETHELLDEMEVVGDLNGRDEQPESGGHVTRIFTRARK
jgi:hypothetical protein